MRPFDQRLLRLAPGARPGIVGLAVLGTITGLAAIAQALAVAHLVFVVVRAQPLETAAVWALSAFAVRGLAQAATEILAARTGSRCRPSCGVASPTACWPAASRHAATAPLRSPS